MTAHPLDRGAPNVRKDHQDTKKTSNFQADWNA
jgi:hypothetical protein